MAEKGGIPTSRLSRSTKVGRLAATTAAKQMGTRATNVARSDEGKQRALAKRQLETAEEIEAKLAELRDAAPKVSFKDMRKVIESEYGERVEDVFETFDPVPIAAASIGQVYKARLHDGRDVAVKVQYPG